MKQDKEKIRGKGRKPREESRQREENKKVEHNNVGEE